MVNECCLCRIDFEYADPKPIEFSMDTDDISAVDFSFEEEQPIFLDVGDSLICRTEGDVYDGSTEVVPKVNVRQILPTNSKIMPDDVTVHAISVFEVSNPEGGKTVTIGTV